MDNSIIPLYKGSNMPKSAQTPVSALKSIMDEYQLTAFSLAKAIGLCNSAVQQIMKGKNKITVSTALRLAKLFGQTPVYWLDLQREADLSEAAKDKELSSVLKGIAKAKKPTAQQKAKPKAKKTTLKDKRKTKVPGARQAKRKPKK